MVMDFCTTEAEKLLASCNLLLFCAGVVSSGWMGWLWATSLCHPELQSCAPSGGAAEIDSKIWHPFEICIVYPVVKKCQSVNVILAQSLVREIRMMTELHIVSCFLPHLRWTHQTLLHAVLRGCQGASWNSDGPHRCLLLRARPGVWWSVPQLVSIGPGVQWFDVELFLKKTMPTVSHLGGKNLPLH